MTDYGGTPVWLALAMGARRGAAAQAETQVDDVLRTQRPLERPSQKLVDRLLQPCVPIAVKVQAALACDRTRHNLTRYAKIICASDPLSGWAAA